MMITDFCPCTELFTGSHAGDGEEVYISDRYDIFEQGGLIGEHDFV